MKTLYIYVPGLGGESILERQRHMMEKWQGDKREVLFLQPRWQSNELLETKLLRLRRKIDSALEETYQQICFVGTSAGGPLAVCLREHFLDARLIAVAGKLLRPHKIGSSYSQPHRALVPCVEKSERLIRDYDAATKAKTWTIAALIDPIVFRPDMKIAGVKHTNLLVPGHIMGIAFSLTLYRHKLFAWAEAT